MTLYDSLWGGVAKVIQGALLPASITVAFFVLALSPGLRHVYVWRKVLDLPGEGQVLLAVLFVVVVSVFLISSVRPAIRLLEGYRGIPNFLKHRMTERHQRHWDDVRQHLHDAATVERVASFLGNLNDYPHDREQVLPTRLGNTLRSGESYGWRQFGLSTNGMWTRLIAVAPESVLIQLNQARSVLDLFVGLIVASGLLFAVTVAVAIIGMNGRYLLSARFPPRPCSCLGITGLLLPRMRMPKECVLWLMYPARSWL